MAIIKKFFGIYIFCILFFMGCDGEDNKEVNVGKIIFYSNAQLCMNCGSFELEVYLEDNLEGIIKNPTYSIEQPSPDCNTKSSDFFLVLEKPEGEYEYEAFADCSGNSIAKGTFSVKTDSCSLVFINVCE